MRNNSSPNLVYHTSSLREAAVDLFLAEQSLRYVSQLTATFTEKIEEGNCKSEAAESEIYYSLRSRH